MGLEFFSLLLLGIVAGSLAGLLGVGGGVVIVPVLAWLFRNHPEIPSTHLMQMAVGTSLATIVVTSVSSIIAHHRRGAVIWNIVWQLTPGIVIGTFVGAVIADALPSDTLRVIFALFLLLVAVQMGFGAQPAPHRQLPHRLPVGLIGIIIGKISALVGIGGGSMTVPFLVWCNVSVRQAVATSAACGFPIAVFGTLGFVVTGWDLNSLGLTSVGYIYLPALVAIIPTSLLFAPLGAKLAHSIPIVVLKRFFAVFLAVVGIHMLLQ
jgi:uncharacterized membrane protein YfcA